jgi:hypothetical protein
MTNGLLIRLDVLFVANVGRGPCPPGFEAVVEDGMGTASAIWLLGLVAVAALFFLVLFRKLSLRKGVITAAICLIVFALLGALFITTGLITCVPP